MVGRPCARCAERPAAVKRSKCATPVCARCFTELLEGDVHRTIAEEALFRPGDTVAVGVSGGKDSAVVLHLLHVLNGRFNYGIHLLMVAIDEGIRGYRDDSLESVYKQQKKYGLPLKVLSYKELFGWSMDEVVDRIGERNNCTYCGVFRRQALERGCQLLGADKLVTGHNADDVAETILMNLLRGDLNRLRRSTGPVSAEADGLPRCKPLYAAFQKEIVLYARFNQLDYFATDCLYAGRSYRGRVRDFVKRLECVRPQAVLDIIRSGREMGRLAGQGALGSLKTSCQRCGAVSSGPLCYACNLLDGLNRLALPVHGHLTPIEEMCPSDRGGRCSCAE